MDPQASIFFGNSYRTAQVVHRLKPLKHIFCERRQFNLDLFNYASLLGAQFTIVDKKADIALQAYSKGTIAVSHGIGVIFTQEHIDALQYGIWNIHTGKLPELRGRHPISWAFLNNHDTFYLSIHEISTEIDQGSLLAEKCVYRDLRDTQSEIEKKFENVLDEGFLGEAYANYFSGKKIPLAVGTYTKSLSGGVGEIIPQSLDSTYVFNLCKAQAKFGGIVVQGTTYKECVFFHSGFKEMYKNYQLFTCRDGVVVGLA